MKKKRLQRARVAPADIETLLAIADDELRLAERIDFDPRGRFIHAYDGARASADAVVRAAGYRARGQGHHETLFKAAAELAVERHEQLRYFNKARDKRNTMVYARPIAPTQAEADELLTHARDFRAFAETWIRANHPDLFPPATAAP